MDIAKLREELLKRVQQMSEEQIVSELESAGFIIRHDLEGPGILNCEGEPIGVGGNHSQYRQVYVSDATYSATSTSVCTYNLSIDFDKKDAGMPVSVDTYYSVQVQIWPTEELQEWTSTTQIRQAS